MILPASTMMGAPRFVAHVCTDFVLLDLLRGEASAEMGAAFDGVPVKKISSAGVPGCSRYGVSRAVHGSDSNPLYRIALLFVVLKRLGMGRERALRMLAWLRGVVDQVWPEEEATEPRKILEEEQRLDALDDAPQQRLAWGEPGAAAEMLEAKRRQHSHDPRVIGVLQRMVWAERTAG